ncbi:MAG: ABC transporter substrate-binding protein [Acidimicrobiales bacterium]
MIRKLGLFGLVSLLFAVTASACSSSSATPGKSNPYHLITPGTLVVGSDLSFKPEMYLANGTPEGYDVVLAHLLAKSLHDKLRIVNLPFAGQIPAVQANKVDMISNGLSPTPVRAKAVSFSRSYVPYAFALAVSAKSHLGNTVATFNRPSVTIAALQGSVDASLITQIFPKAHTLLLPDDTSAMLDVATGRATAVVVENYLLAAFEKANSGELKSVSLPSKILPIYYGSYAVKKGNTALVKYLNSWICREQRNGTMARVYQSTIGAKLPPMPAC